MNERIIRILARRLSGEASEQELKELEDWVKSHPDDDLFHELLERYWNSDLKPVIGSETTDSRFEHILQKADAEEDTYHQTLKPVFKRRVIGKKWWVAASFIGLVAVSFWLWPNLSRSGSKQEVSHITTTKGARSQMLLPDGSKVWLNADSKLEFDKKFDGPLREVFLEGEAFFDVKKDTKRPFIVHTSAIDIKVLGTAFNVKSYHQENTIEATLIRGLIEVSNNLTPGSGKVLLRPKEKLIFNKAIGGNSDQAAGQTEKKSSFAISALPVKNTDSLFAETSWVYDKMIFDGESFRELATKIERWYNVDIRFTSEAVASYRLRGEFEDESITEALEALKIIAPFKYKMHENKIEISEP